MTSTYTRRRLLKTATVAGMGMAIVPLTALLPNAHATSRRAFSNQTEKSVSVLMDGWLLRPSDR